jgi:hypothetical protein
MTNINYKEILGNLNTEHLNGAAKIVEVARNLVFLKEQMNWQELSKKLDLPETTLRRYITKIKDAEALYYEFILTTKDISNAIEWKFGLKTKDLINEYYAHLEGVSVDDYKKQFDSIRVGLQGLKVGE